MQQRIHVIINPASGQRRAPLEGLASALRAAGVSWKMSISRSTNDATRLARHAAQNGADVVAAYGGDGAVASVADGLLGTNRRLAVLGGGTANVFAATLGVPSSPVEACALACGRGRTTAAFDVLEVQQEPQGGAPRHARHVLLQAGLGLHARVIAHTSRARKRRLGWLAYALETVRQLARTTPTRFRLTLDGGDRRIERTGIACFVCNGGRMGSGGLQVAPPAVCAHDGRLDVLLIERANLATARALLRRSLWRGAPGGATSDAPIAHWQAQSVRVETPAPRPVQGDGNVIAQTPVTARVLPGALPVVVPEGATALRRARRV